MRKILSVHLPQHPTLTISHIVLNFSGPSVVYFFVQSLRLVLIGITMPTNARTKPINSGGIVHSTNYTAEVRIIQTEDLLLQQTLQRNVHTHHMVISPTKVLSLCY